MEINFDKISNVIYNGKELKNIYAVVTHKFSSTTDLPKLIWSYDTSGYVDIVFSYYDRSTGSKTVTLKFPPSYTWEKVARMDSRFIFDSQGDMIWTNDVRQWWIATDTSKFVNKDDNLIKGEHYFLVRRTLNVNGDEIKYSPLSLGDNEIIIKADEPNFYFFAKEAGTYVFKASSNNAFLGYEEKKQSDEGEEYFEATWVDGTSFELEAKEGETLYICCSNQDFSYETYTLNIKKE